MTITGAVLRLYRLESGLQFLGDQGRDALVMYRLIAQGDLPFIGPITSVGGFYLGPLYYYLMAPFLWLARFDPVGPAAATAVLGVMTVPALYLVADKISGRKAAWLTAAMYAVAFIPISETRSAWNPNLMPLAALGIIYGFYSNNLPLTALSLGTALQFHYMIVFLTPWLVWQAWLARGNKQLVKSLIILLLLMIPLILFEVKNNWLNVRGLIEFLGKHRYGSLNLGQVIKDTVGRSEQAIGMVLGFGRNFSILRTWLTRGWLLLLLIFFKKNKFLGIYLLTSIFTLAVYQENIYPHYLGFLFPAVFMLTAVFLSQLPQLFTAAVLVLFLVYNAGQTFQLLSQSGNLKSVRATAEFVNSDIKLNGHTGVNVALIDGTRDYPAMNLRYFLTLAGAPLLNYDQYPESQILYVVSPYEQTDILKQPMWEIQALYPARLTQSWQLPNVSNIYKIERL